MVRQLAWGAVGFLIAFGFATQLGIVLWPVAAVLAVALYLTRDRSSEYEAGLPTALGLGLGVIGIVGLVAFG